MARSAPLYPTTRAATAALASLAGLALAASTPASAETVSQKTYPKSDLLLVTTVINATNPYMASWIQGSKDLAAKLGVPLEIVQSNGSSQTELAGIQAQAAKGKKIVLVTNPVAASNVPAVVNTVKANGGYMVVWWNMPPGYEPQTAGDTLVAFGTYNGVTAGKCGAEHLLKAMGGKGGIIALPGTLDSTVSQERYAGLIDAMKAYPDVKLLDTQPANWDQSIALRTTQQLISKYGEQIGGVWTADDAMMLGAYQAFNQAGRLDKVKFSGEGAYPPAIDLMQKRAGNDAVVGSAFHRGYMAAATGMLIAYDAAVGDLDVAKLTPEQRHGQYAVGCVTPENAKDYAANGGIPAGWLDGLIKKPFMDLVGGPGGPAREVTARSARPLPAPARACLRQAARDTRRDPDGGGTMSAAGSPSAAGIAPAPRGAPDLVRALAEVGVLVALVVVFSAIDPSTFPTRANLATVLNTAAVPAIVGVGSTFVILTGRIDLSVEGVMGACGLAFVLLSPNSRTGGDVAGSALPLALPAALALGAGLGLATGLVHVWLRVPTFIVSLGMWYVALGIAAVLFGEEMQPFLSDPDAALWTTAAPLGLPNAFLLALAVTAAGFGLERYTRLGRLPFAIGSNEGVARLTGVPVARTCLVVFAIAGACSGLAGVVASLSLGAGAANVGNGMLFFTLAAVVIGGTPLGGGRGGVLRTLVGVLILSTLYNGLILSGVAPAYQSGVSGLVLVAAVVAAGWPQRHRLRIVK